MACINMYNPDGGAAFGGGQPGPRISFSSDFSMEPPPAPVQNRATSLRCQEEDQNFEFSVGSHTMMAADQLFSKGRILPFKDGRPPATLRDELRGADDERASSLKGSSRWREMLGLRKSSLFVGGTTNNASASAAKKSDKVVAVDADMAASTKPRSYEVINRPTDRHMGIDPSSICYRDHTPSNHSCRLVLLLPVRGQLFSLDCSRLINRLIPSVLAS